MTFINVTIRLRSFIFLVLQSIFTILFAIFGFFLIFSPFKIRYQVITQWSHLNIWLAKKICKIEFEVQGLDNIPKTEGVVLCKHQSTWETLFLQSLFPHQTWVLKKELLKLPFFGWGLRLLEPIAIDRKKKSSIKQLIEQGKNALAQGKWVIIFPEGKRMAPKTTGHYSRSGAALAQAAQVPIIPITHNAGQYWPRGAFIKRPGTIIVRIGPPIWPKDDSPAELTERAKQWIESHIPTD